MITITQLELLYLIGAIIIAAGGVCVTLIKCAWKLSATITNLVTHENCSKRRKECPCHKEIEVIKKELF